VGGHEFLWLPSLFVCLSVCLSVTVRLFVHLEKGVCSLGCSATAYVRIRGL
jgi:hypothetical protein